MQNTDAKIERKWKWTPRTYQIADTGDYGGHHEFTNGVILLTSDELAERKDCESLIKALDPFADMRCPQEEATAMILGYEREQAKLVEEENQRLKEVNALCQGFIETLLVRVAEGRLNLEDDESGDLAREAIAFAEALLKKMHP